MLNQMPSTYCFGPSWFFELQQSNRRLLRGGVAVAIGSRAFEVLLALVEARGDLVTKEQLLQRAWPGLIVEEANVYVTVSQLRKILGNDAIETVGGLGYRFALAIKEPSPGDLPRHNLPAERTPFIGREAVLHEAQRKLQQARLLTLVGIGGTGKTRLARKLAEFALADHRDGVRWVDLAPLSTGAMLAPALAGALDCGLDSPGSASAAIKACCRDLQILIVLDNCEHLLDSVATTVDELLTTAPGVRVLATSREALGVADEATLHVHPMQLPGVGDTAESIGGFDSVRLFVDRAAAASSEFALDEDTTPVVANICRRLDGLPLALELAAVRLRLLSVHQLLGMLDERFLLLTGGVRALPRQQTLRAMIHWSYEAAGVEAQRTMRAIAACAGGCDVETVAALLEADRASMVEVVGSLGRLLDLALISVSSTGPVARYSMLETVSQYALERLGEHGEASAVRGRHRDHFGKLVEQMDSQCTGDAPAKWTQRLATEQDNVLAAIAWCAAPGGAEAGLRFVVALRRYWSARGLLLIGHDLGAEALTRPGAQRRDALRARALIAHAQTCWSLDRAREGRAHAQEALDIAAELGDQALRGRALRTLSYLHGALGELEAAGQHAHEALRLARSAGDPIDLCDAMVAVADHHFESGELARSAEIFEEVLALRRQLDLRVEEGLTAVALADIAIELRQPERAAAWLHEAHELALRTGSRYVGHHVIERSAALAALKEDWRVGLRWFSASTAQRRSTGLSEKTMVYQQRVAALQCARSALDPRTAAQAEDDGASLAYEETLEEVQAWLR